MNGCMGTGKPLISILMAVYEPRLDWLREQLLSLNAQTYPNLRLYIRDDCSPTVPYDTICACVEACITAFPYSIVRNEKNIGSNGTFERLTVEAEGVYFAYCDQDDVWLSEKLERLQSALEDEKATMAYCDMAVIDGKGNPLAASLRVIRSRLRYVSGTDLAETYFFQNCTAGCSMLLQAKIAKWALPFLQWTIYDQWLALLAALDGPVAFVDTPLVRYRIHGGNQTGILHGVYSKVDYYEKQLMPLRERLEFYEHYTCPSPELCGFVVARLAGRWIEIWKGRKLCEKEAWFELALPILPEPLFRWILRKVKREA